MTTSDFHTLIYTKDLDALTKALQNNPALANEELPVGDGNPATAHPLHRICDGVFFKKYSDEEAVELAKIFLKHGARVNGNELIEKKDTPLIAAASLHADEVALLYIDSGAEIHHPGTHGGTALHWAAWCGRERVVKKLIEQGAEINRLCIDFKSTPLFWAMHGMKNGGYENTSGHTNCARLLMEAGADKNITNFEGASVNDLLDDDNVELRRLFN